jgi:hypothetical protein
VDTTWKAFLISSLLDEKVEERALHTRSLSEGVRARCPDQAVVSVLTAPARPVVRRSHPVK